MIDFSKLKTELSLTYKGTRNYIQGADIWLASEELLKSEYPRGFIQQISLKKFAYGKCELRGTNNSEQYFGSVLINDGYGNVSSGFLVDTKTSLQEKTSFNEEKLWKLLEFEENSVTLNTYSPFSVHQTVVSMIKVFINKYSQPLDGRWVFVRATMSVQPPCKSIVGQIYIKLTKEITGRFVQFEVKVNGNFIGTVDFGVGSP